MAAGGGKGAGTGEGQGAGTYTFCRETLPSLGNTEDLAE